MSGLSPNPLQAALDEHAIASGDMIILAGSRAFYDAKDRRDKARRRIVQRVKAHDELLAAAKEAEDFCAGFFDDGTQEPVITELLAKLRAAIATATGSA
jgi:hypothetical protein